MKHLPILIGLFVAVAVAVAQQIVEVPVKMTVTLPPATNIARVNMPGLVIAPTQPPVEFIKVITGPTTFVLGTFPANTDLVMWVFNPSSNSIAWPANLIVMGTPMPTNQMYSVILFQENQGRIFAFPAIQVK